MQERKPNERKRTKVILRVAMVVAPVMAALLLLSQTVFAQNTYVITDGDRVVVYTSTTTDPAAVLDEAGLALGEDDTYTTQPGLGLSEITIQRSQTVTVNNCGEVLLVNSTEESVSQLLKELGITVDSDMTVSVPMDAEPVDGMEITITQTVYSTETYTASIPYETTYCSDASVPAGTELTITQGVNGQALCTAEVVYVNGVETSRTVLKQTVLDQPVNEVIAQGTSNESLHLDSQKPIIKDGTITLPTGEVLTYYRKHQVIATAYTHTDEGCDFITATGTRVRVGTVAVDPTLIPYGTKMFIVSNDGYFVYGIGTAEDCGGGIKGDRIDLYYPTPEECFFFGRRPATIYFLG